MCQGHHLATFGVPLFAERIAAWDLGPVVERLWSAEKHGWKIPPSVRLDEAALNTIGYVLSRYGTLTGKDLEVMTHGEAPWQLANATRMPGGSTPIRPEWMVDYFRTDGAPGDGMDDPLDTASATARPNNSVDPGAEADSTLDGPDDLRAWATRGR